MIVNTRFVTNDPRAFIPREKLEGEDIYLMLYRTWKGFPIKVLQLLSDDTKPGLNSSYIKLKLNDTFFTPQVGDILAVYNFDLRIEEINLEV